MLFLTINYRAILLILKFRAMGIPLGKILLKTIINTPLPTLALLYGFLFLFLYPQALLIADEKAYTEQALALSHGERYLETAFAAEGGIPKHYPLGTALAGAALVWLTGPQGVFLLGALSLLLTFATTASLLRRLGYADFWSVLMFLYPPALLLSRQVMSELPGLAVLSLFFWLVFSVDLRGGRAGGAHANLPDRDRQGRTTHNELIEGGHKKLAKKKCAKLNFTQRRKARRGNTDFAYSALRPPPKAMGRRRLREIIRFILLWAQLLAQPLISLAQVGEHSFRSRQVWGALAVGFLAGVSLAFRETNLLLVVPFLAELVWRRHVHVPALLLGGVLGLSVRLLSAAWAYGDWLYVKDPGAGFGLQYVPGNALIYGLALCVFIPLGLPAVFRYRGPLRVSLWASIGIFTLFHLFYGYNGWAASGVYAFVLGPRFFVPALPLFVLAVADWWGRRGAGFGGALNSPGGSEKNSELRLGSFHPLNLPSTFAKASVNKPAGESFKGNPTGRPIWIRRAAYLLAVLSIVGGQVGSHLLGSSHRRVVDQLYAHAAAPNYFSFNGPLWKYESALYGDLRAADISRLQGEGLPGEVFYLHLMDRRDTPERRRQSARQRQELAFLWPQVDVLAVDSVATLDGVVLRSFVLKEKEEGRGLD
jgi:hypothetical protein